MNGGAGALRILYEGGPKAARDRDEFLWKQLPYGWKHQVSLGLRPRGISPYARRSTIARQFPCCRVQRRSSGALRVRGGLKVPAARGVERTTQRAREGPRST